jgi:hypothetical protein
MYRRLFQSTRHSRPPARRRDPSGADAPIQCMFAVDETARPTTTLVGPSERG